MEEEKNEKRKEQMRKASEKYLKEKVEDIRIRVPKGDKAKYKQAADDFEISLNQFVIDAMDEKIVLGLRKEDMTHYEAEAKARGYSLNKFALEAMDEKIEREPIEE